MLEWIDINSKSLSETLLMVCVRKVFDPTRRLALLKTILNFKPDINLQDGKGQTAFISACICEQEDTINLFLRQPSLEVNITDNDGFTGFMYACETGNKNLVKLLVDAHLKRQISLDLSKINCDGKTALQIVKERHDSGLFAIVNDAYGHKSYTKPVSCVSDDNDFRLFDKVKSKKLKSKQNAGRSGQRMSMSAIRRALKEAYMSDEEDDVVEENHSKDKNGITDLVKVVRECATDLRQIYHEQEKNQKGGQKGSKKIQQTRNKPVPENHGRNEQSITDMLTTPGKKRRKRKTYNDQFTVETASTRESDSYDMTNETRTINTHRAGRKERTTKVHFHPAPKGINIDSITVSTKREEGERKIVLSDTSNYDKKLAVKPKPKYNRDDMYRRVNGMPSSSLPLSVSGTQNKYASRLPNRKIWSSLEQGNVALPSISRPSSRTFLPPLKEGFQARRAKENPVKIHDKGMWKIMQGYK
ncbi:KANK [Mytilus edulis]|uniref:KANK n=1 Tax=Mytilus edulis TaxID=6550 RepID=A0A8S3QFG5_MYTED|nr:KANK [Mytilus edulis]